MRRLAIALVPLFLLACDREPVAPESEVLPTLAAIHTTDNTIDLPWAYTDYFPCAGEFIQAEGTIHFLVTETLTPSGRYSLHWIGQPQGLKGVGLTSGLEYKFAGFTQGSFVGGESFPIVDHFENRFIVIGPGAGNNSVWFDTYKIVINAPGDYVVEVEKHRVECR